MVSGRGIESLDRSGGLVGEEQLLTQGVSVLDSDLDIVSVVPKMRGARKFRLVSFVGILFVVITTLVTVMTPFRGADSPQCRPIYMYPSYASIDGFDERYNRLAKKYHLFLYREQGKDRVPIDGNEIQLDGIPVLFIPGNAGSYKQVRSIAAACSNLYFEGLDTIDNKDVKNLDFFSADFNEDFTALHGRTMLDQAEYLNDAIRYILSLYEQAQGYSGPKPESVVIVGHSMGGIVARVMPTLQNYIEGSINTVFTLSSPHAAAPVTFDGDILKVYQRTNDFWKSQFEDNGSNFSKNVSLISITGSILDTVLPSDYTTVEDFLPEGNGFTTYTTTIPGVWSPIDHLAIVWCDQLRRVMARILLEITDVNSPTKVKSLQERMYISRKYLLSGLENQRNALQNLERASVDFKKFEESELRNAIKPSSGNSIELRGPEAIATTNYILFEKPSEGETSKFFSMISTIEDLELYMCKESTPETDEDSKKYLNCMKATELLVRAPTEYTDPDSEENVNEYRIFKWNFSKNSEFTKVLIVLPTRDLDSREFISAKVQQKPVMSYDSPSLLKSLFYSASFGSKMDSNSYIINFPLWDSLVSYRIRAKLVSGNHENILFKPFIRQWIEEPYETKWHAEIFDHDVDISMHSIAPFVPYQETHPRSLNLEVFVPPNTELIFAMRINWLMTLKRLFLRYRLAVGSFPVFILALSMAYQFYWYNKTSTYMDLKTATGHLIQKFGLPIILFLIVLNPICNNRYFQMLLYAIDPIGLNSPTLVYGNHIDNNPYYLGLRSVSLSILGPFFFIMTVGVLTLLFDIFGTIEKLLKLIRNTILKNYLTSKISAKPLKFDRKRFTTSFFLLILTLFYIPYQLTFVIIFIIQIATWVRSILFIPDTVVGVSNIRNYNLSLLFVFIFVTMINAPVVVVFMHNVAIRWETPFRSHHNIMAIIPMILLVGLNSTFNIPKFKSNRIYDGGAVVGLLLYLSLFSLIYGIRNMYWIHYIVNFICAWLYFGSLHSI
ncbi:hypothetical protein Kpol_1058p23 [Vanderwaltozyma polyspora DSM 70294]|uniref:GPI inositol-deacylase n=1 Tax=Vanderwaltozyma polyspora (strain ATCC 22028 / DSM 70294 / BCRC 21397 / CBS 2163 / NBRC 10782 / NRRL Y-8283 / UCD 57-17) TaxID=436907 RepID=A7TJQ7_VANPO|nr:uncharacterized protein Kpol_1058p23 [Vanderwaltozyma polyspora DSM 70294]EDO17486.1 hypothetical protein Kpol_1058p23 [Vanderwaltozyma polyspora DSM 70294]